MSCNAPLAAWRHLVTARSREAGDREVRFTRDNNWTESLSVPCGKCMGCLLRWSRDWAIRCEHESYRHLSSCFITLTYAKPPWSSTGLATLRKDDLQRFFKRVRKHSGADIKYFASGEYGSRTLRPHYHAVVFGYQFTDLRIHSLRGQHALYTSTELQSLWPHGHSSTGQFSSGAGHYVTRYVAKKPLQPVTNNDGREDEFHTMSRRPGLGFKWFEEFGEDMYRRDDEVHMAGKTYRPPVYYDNLLRERNKPLWQTICLRRWKHQREAQPPNETAREMKLRSMRSTTRGRFNE